MSSSSYTIYDSEEEDKDMLQTWKTYNVDPNSKIRRSAFHNFVSPKTTDVDDNNNDVNASNADDDTREYGSHAFIRRYASDIPDPDELNRIAMCNREWLSRWVFALLSAMHEAEGDDSKVIFDRASRAVGLPRPLKPSARALEKLEEHGVLMNDTGKKMLSITEAGIEYLRVAHCVAHSMAWAKNDSAVSSVIEKLDSTDTIVCDRRVLDAGLELLFMMRNGPINSKEWNDAMNIPRVRQAFYERRFLDALTLDVLYQKSKYNVILR